MCTACSWPRQTQPSATWLPDPTSHPGTSKGGSRSVLDHFTRVGLLPVARVDNIHPGSVQPTPRMQDEGTSARFLWFRVQAVWSCLWLGLYATGETSWLELDGIIACGTLWGGVWLGRGWTGTTDRSYPGWPPFSRSTFYWGQLIQILLLLHRMVNEQPGVFHYTQKVFPWKSTVRFINLATNIFPE